MKYNRGTTCFPSVMYWWCDTLTLAVLVPQVSTCNCVSPKTSNVPVSYEPDCNVLAWTNNPSKNVSSPMLFTCTANQTTHCMCTIRRHGVYKVCLVSVFCPLPLHSGSISRKPINLLVYITLYGKKFPGHPPTYAGKIYTNRTSPKMIVWSCTDQAARNDIIIQLQYIRNTVNLL